jgi:outer membrane protein assembly factor BamB
MIRRRPASRPLWRLLRALLGVASTLLVATTTATAHGGTDATTGAGSSLVAAVPTWLGVALGLALVALGVALVGRAVGNRDRWTTRAVGSVAVVLLAGSVLVVVVGATGVGLPDGGGDDGPSAETPLWVSDTGRTIGGNHHAAAVSDGRVYAPLSGPGTPEGCELVALHGADGGVVWRAPVETNCTIHAVADPAVADTDGDGTDEVLVATTEEDLRVYDRDGDLQRRSALTDYGYTRPVVADLDGRAGAETVVVDVRGTVVVVDEAGETVWQHALDDYVWARPVVGDVDGDGSNEVFVAQRDGTLTLLSGTGGAVGGEADAVSDGETGATVEWSTTVGDSPAVSWLAAGQADDDPALELVVATVDGGVYAVDGASGKAEWSRRVDRLASVGGFGDGDGDGDPEVYVADRSGHVRALDAATGDEEWVTRVTDESVQMMPPPSLGDTDGDGAPDLVVPAHDGSVSKLDPRDGHLLARYERSVADAASDRGRDRIFSRATLGDVDGDGDDDAVVIYADGTVVALDF